MSRRSNYFEESEKINRALFNQTKKKFTYNKQYLMTVSKIQKDESLFKEIKNAAKKIRLARNDLINNQKELLSRIKLYTFKN